MWAWVGEGRRVVGVVLGLDAGIGMSTTHFMIGYGMLLYTPPLPMPVLVLQRSQQHGRTRHLQFAQGPTVTPDIRATPVSHPRLGIAHASSF